MDKKRKIIVIVVILVLLSVVAYWVMPKNSTLSDSKVFDEEAVKAAAEQVVELLNAEDYEGLQAMTVEEGKSVMTAEKLQEAKEQSGLDSDWGEFVEVKEIKTGEVSQRGVNAALVQLVAQYENQEITYMIAFDKDMNVASFGMQ